MKSMLTLLILLLNFGTYNAHARDMEYYRNILDEHPKVKAVLEQHSALNYQAEGAMGLPDPTLFLGIDNVPISDPSFNQYLPSSKVFGLSQNIPNSTTRKAQKAIFLSTASTTELLADYTRSRLHSAFFSRMADLERVKKQTKYEEQKRHFIDQLQDYYEGQISSGEPIFQKIYITEIEQAEVEQKLNTLHSELSIIIADFVQLVGEVPQLEQFSYQEKNWSGDLRELYPVHLAYRNVDVEKAEVDLASSKFLPDFGVVASYKVREDGANNMFDGDDWFSLQFRMSVPLWASKNQHPKLEAAKSRKRSAEQSYRGALRTWQMEMARIFSQKHASRLNLDVLEKKNQALEKKIKAMERTYSAGQTSLEPVLQTELARLSLLSQIAGEEARLIRVTEEFNTHIMERKFHETK